MTKILASLRRKAKRMQNNTSIKKILIRISLIILILVCAYSLYKAYLIVKKFEGTLEAAEKFTPRAMNVEMTQNGTNSKPKWKVKAEVGTSNKEMTLVDAKNVEAIIFDKEAKPKAFIKADSSALNKNDSSCKLVGNVKVKFENENTSMEAQELYLVKDKPTEIKNGVKFSMTSDPNRYILANRAYIDEKVETLTLYDIAPSPVSNGVILEGGQTTVNLKGENSKITILNGAKVTTAGNVCRSRVLDLYMKNNKPYLAVFTGNPVAQKDKKTMRAEIIEYDLEKEKLTAKGRVKVN